MNCSGLDGTSATDVASLYFLIPHHAMSAAARNGAIRYGTRTVETGRFNTAVATSTRRHITAEAAITPNANGVPASISLLLARANDNVTFVDETIPPNMPAMG